jgi:hypothetical protein
VTDEDYARLGASQTSPVDEARERLAFARDELGRAKLAAVNDQHEGALARSDQGAASADLSRADAETKIGKDSNEPGQVLRAQEDTHSARQGKDVADARLAYAGKLKESREAQVAAAERGVDLMTEKVNVAKLQSLDDAAVPAAGKYDHAAALRRLADAQREHDRATAAATRASQETAAAKERWQVLAGNAR